MSADMPDPPVSVLMTTYNGAHSIAASIASVLAQSFHDFELIVVDDGSTDATPDILAACPDPRLRVIRSTRNSGVVAARNLGFAAARGAYVAMLDHDDLAHADRLARQVAYLDRHPRVVLLATEIELAADGRRWAPDHPRGGDPLLLRWLLHVDNPLTWSSVMLRADAVCGLDVFLRAEFELADDFELYHRLLAVGDIARLDEPLTVYRWHAHNTTYGNEDRQNASAMKVLRTAYAPWLGADAEAAARLVVRHLSDRKPVHDAATLDQLGGYFERLLDGFCAAHCGASADRQRIRAVSGEIWWRIVRASVRAGAPGLLGHYRRRPGLAADFRPPPVDKVASLAIGVVRSGRRAISGRRGAAFPG
jgi:glycosyltransferase involved in cell wall biosynthesis